MRIGDLVEYNDNSDEAQGRICGIIVRTDVYKTRSIGLSSEPIVEVLWNNGLGWILRSRVRLANESR